MPVDIDGLSLNGLMQLNHRVVEPIKMLQAMQAHVDMMAFNLGSKVNFETDEGRVIGTLIKYNRKTLNVLSDDGRQYRVTPDLLSPVKEIDITANARQPTKRRKKKRLR